MTVKELLLERLARYFRFQKGLEYVTKNKPIILADLGCGPEIAFYNFGIKHRIKFSKYIGVDPLLSKEVSKNYQSDTRVKLIKNSLSRRIPLKDSSCDYIISFASLEHFNNPKIILNESIRILKKGGKAIFTTPTPWAKPILEFLAFRMGVLSKREIGEHKNYFDKKTLLSLLKGSRDATTKHKYFELGFNNLLVIKKG